MTTYKTSEVPIFLVMRKVSGDNTEVICAAYTEKKDAEESVKDFSETAARKEHELFERVGPFAPMQFTSFWVMPVFVSLKERVEDGNK